MPKTSARSALLFSAFALASSIGVAQQSKWPQPTAPMQAGIDKDTSRHFGDAPVDPGPLASDLSPALTPAAIDAATRKVADWQLRVSEPYFEHIWTWSVLYSGFIAASESTGDPKYREAMQHMSEHFHYELAGRTPNADTQSIAQTYLELYMLQAAHDRAWSPDLNQTMVAPTRADLDNVINLPTVRAGDPRIPWWWCDALFMAPPVWARMYAVTGDHKYIDYLDKQWANTYAVLWDADEHLYARDETFKSQRSLNGKKIFWSRGEGWVMGGLARTLEYLPKDDPRRAFYEQNLRDLAAAVTRHLDPKTHLLHASLLDPEHFPLDETSGSALYLYGLAWGVNEGVLDAKTYRPVIDKVWAGLLHHVYADGRFGGIQQTGAEPAFYPPSASFTYGVGGYLLATAELKRMSLGHHAPPRLAQQLPPYTKQLPSSKAPSATTDPANHAHIELPTPADPNLQNLILVGDSTVRNGKGDGANNQMGWGDELAQYFDLSKINVVNRAIGWPQLSHLHHRRPLGVDPALHPHWRCCADPVRA
ncbi:MAG: glycoside hydrolase family 88 protein [Acidobacteriaceae bacterium]|nr:glycoside hydrolase family 88 protein [Acidobacteriaceae bacterium]